MALNPISKLTQSKRRVLGLLRLVKQELKSLPDNSGGRRVKQAFQELVDAIQAYGSE